MNRRVSGRVLVILVAWGASLAAAGMWGSAAAQRSEDAPAIVFGEDVGFRITGLTRRGARQGTLMVRVEGKWVEAELAPRMAVHPVR